jgi:hypothetical protein
MGNVDPARFRFVTQDLIHFGFLYQSGRTVYIESGNRPAQFIHPMPGALRPAIGSIGPKKRSPLDLVAGENGANRLKDQAGP